MVGRRVPGPKLVGAAILPALEPNMNRTTVKKFVGTLGAAIGTASIWLLANQSHLVALFPRYGDKIAFATAFVSLMASWWGKHPGSSPSVNDAVIDGMVPGSTKVCSRRHL
jgi:hypothetical protein